MIVSDKRMPGMHGSEVLARFRELYPIARRVLLIGHADIDAVIQALNDAHVDQYLSKPWQPPEERLFPVLDDLLDAWQAEYLPQAVGLRLVGHRGHRIHTRSSPFWPAISFPIAGSTSRATRRRASCWTPLECKTLSYRRCSLRTALCCEIRTRGRLQNALADLRPSHSMCTIW